MTSLRAPIVNGLFQLLRLRRRRVSHPIVAANANAEAPLAGVGLPGTRQPHPPPSVPPLPPTEPPLPPLPPFPPVAPPVPAPAWPPLAPAAPALPLAPLLPP